MVLGLFSTASEAALCLDNLAEADFDSHDISLVMKTRQDVDKIARVSGALTGLAPDELAARLVGFGLPAERAETYKAGVLNGEVFIAITPPSGEDSAAEMLKDANAEAIQILKKG